MPDECDDEGFVVDESDGDEVDLFEELEAEMAAKSGVTSRSWPRAIYAYLKFGYDRTLKNQLQNTDRTDFSRWIDAVMTHVQVHYRHSSLPTKIEFKVLTLRFCFRKDIGTKHFMISPIKIVFEKGCLSRFDKVSPFMRNFQYCIPYDSYLEYFVCSGIILKRFTKIKTFQALNL